MINQIWDDLGVSYFWTNPYVYQSMRDFLGVSAFCRWPDHILCFYIFGWSHMATVWSVGVNWRWSWQPWLKFIALSWDDSCGWGEVLPESCLVKVERSQKGVFKQNPLVCLGESLSPFLGKSPIFNQPRDVNCAVLKNLKKRLSANLESQNPFFFYPHFSNTCLPIFGCTSFWDTPI